MDRFNKLFKDRCNIGVNGRPSRGPGFEPQQTTIINLDGTYKYKKYVKDVIYLV